MNKGWVLILGAGSDIARATARRFAESGHDIYLASRNVIDLNAEAANLALKYNVAAKSYYFDALKPETHEAFYNRLNPKPAGVILSYGMLGDQILAQKDFSMAKMVIDTNYTSAVGILEIIAADFEKRQTGFIAGVSSVAGDRGRQSNYIYGSAKAGFSAYLSGLCHRMYKSGVHVLTVKPGFVDTKMTATLDLPGNLTAKPEKVAEQIFKAVQKRKNVIYVKPVWRMIMLIIIHLPNFIFKRTKL
jgi:short-subunit dehydrogenase